MTLLRLYMGLMASEARINGLSDSNQQSLEQIVTAVWEFVEQR